MARPTFELSSDTRFLKQRLEKMAVDEFISYADLGAVISKTIGSACPALISARNILLRENNMVFGVVRGAGLKRLSDKDIVRASEQDRFSIRRKARKATKKLASADYTKLSSREQLDQTIKMSVFAAISQTTSDATSRRLEKHIKALGKPVKELSIAETVKAIIS